MSPPRPTTVPALGPTIELPFLSAQEAYVLVDVLDRLLQALWASYGDEMLDIAAGYEVPDWCCDDEPDDVIAS